MINKEINMRTTLTIPKSLKSKLELLAKNENRSVNNLIVTVLYKYVNEELVLINKKKHTHQ
ncbi:DNA-binding protein [Paraclostridium sp. AKS73]|uniref:DNA-binding protein n=1 Tax=Paraclostridium sp. AKS73 TaxID=2876116 RepID=UPI0021E0193C|nr:DNA-binding protein [Paraclostridium sp. AKS73]MCU9814480.1 DNA-binding protein [Paraclostridium sp. AKS73]